MIAYLNGDGNGKGTHLSIFMEIQPGEYDALLPWPFAHEFTFTLFDQSTNTNEVLFTRGKTTFSKQIIFRLDIYFE